MWEYYETTWGLKGIGFRGVQSFTTAQEADAQTGLTSHAQELLDRYALFLTPAQHQVVKDYFIEQTKWAQLIRKQ